MWMIACHNCDRIFHYVSGQIIVRCPRCGTMHVCLNGEPLTKEEAEWLGGI